MSERVEERDELRRACIELAEAAGVDHEDVERRALRLAERLAARRFHVSVLGEFQAREVDVARRAESARRYCRQALFPSLPSRRRSPTVLPG